MKLKVAAERKVRSYKPLHSLYQLHNCYRILFKILLSFAFNLLNGMAPVYTPELLTLTLENPLMLQSRFERKEDTGLSLF